MKKQLLSKNGPTQQELQRQQIWCEHEDLNWVQAVAKTSGNEKLIGQLVLNPNLPIDIGSVPLVPSKVMQDNPNLSGDAIVRLLRKSRQTLAALDKAGIPQARELLAQIPARPPGRQLHSIHSQIAAALAGCDPSLGLGRPRLVLKARTICGKIGRERFNQLTPEEQKSVMDGTQVHPLSIRNNNPSSHAP